MNLFFLAIVDIENLSLTFVDDVVMEFGITK